MGTRYRFIDLATISTEVELLGAIALPASPMQTFALYGQSQEPMKHVLETLKAIGTLTLLIQDKVRDPDFLAEHEVFYSKQHRTVSRLCIRLHAFSRTTPVLADPNSPTSAETLAFLDGIPEGSNQYLGFVTIRPLRHAPVAASILKPPANAGVTCHETFPVHIAGRDFEVEGTPYLQQDNAVGACAQASIWIALRTQMKRVGNTAYTTAELTLSATRYLATDRVFPGRQGLIIQQMLEAIRSSDHDPLTLDFGGDISTATPASAVLEQALPYIESGLPVIASLFPPSGGHAVVMIGRRFSKAQLVTEFHKTPPLNIQYALASDWASELAIHNDNTGPYVTLTSGDHGSNNYCLEHTQSLIVPLPETVFLTAKEAERSALKSLAYISVIRTSLESTTTPRLTPEVDIVLRTCLVQRHAFRKWALEDTDMDADLKTAYRTLELPRLIWVVEVHDQKLFNPSDPDNRSRVGEFLIDASADSLHGDATLCAHITRHAFPSYQGPAGLLLQVNDLPPEEMAFLSTGELGKSLARPWA